MNRRKAKFISSVVVLTLCFSGFIFAGIPVAAEESTVTDDAPGNSSEVSDYEVFNFNETVVNPVWSEVLASEEISVGSGAARKQKTNAPAKTAISVSSGNAYHIYDDVISAVRKGFEDRQSDIIAEFILAEDEVPEPEAKDLGIASRALSAMDPYRAALIISYHCGVSYYEKDGLLYGNIRISDSSYWTTQEQERAFESKLSAVIDELSINSLSDYDKIKAIFDYIVTNVSYDSSNSSRLVYTAYGALIEGKAACQGYSLLLYKMAEAAGLDAQYLHGMGLSNGEQELHAWNGVRVNGNYYFLDSTWDSIALHSGKSGYDYFLKGSDAFERDHTPDAEYSVIYSAADYHHSGSEGEIGAALEFGFSYQSGKWYWYENWKRQAVPGDPKNIIDEKYQTERGREIYDPNSDGWYWLDSVYGGAKAVDKEVWIPYVYQDEDNWSVEEISSNAAASGPQAEQVKDTILANEGKWVRYDANGKMYKGWYTVTGRDAAINPSQSGNTYYYDPKTGLMAKGTVVIGDRSYHFDETTGVLD